MLPLIALILITGVFLYQLVKLYLGRNSDVWKKQGIPTLVNNISLLDFVSGKKTVADLDCVFYNQLGDEKFGGSVELGRPVLFVKDLELARLIFVKDFDNFFERREFSHSDPLTSESLFFLDGKKWKDMRGFLSPTFTSGKIRRMFHHMDRSAEKMLKYMESGSSSPKESDKTGYDVNLHEVMKRFALEVIASAAFGLDVNAFKDSNSVFFKMAEKMGTLDLERTVRFGICQMFPKVADLLKLWALQRDVGTFFMNTLSQAFRARDSSQNSGDDFLQLLVEAKRGDNKIDESELNAGEKEALLKSAKDKKTKLALTEEMAMAQAFVFILAGFDTISNNLMVANYILAAQPEIQEKVFQEVEDILEITKGQITYEAVNQMEYMDMFISEVLRLYPGVSRLERKAHADYKIPNTDKVIPKGTIVAFAAEAFHRDEKYFPDPMTFDPERFNAENKAKRNPYCYMPFGIGPRNCIGMRFALIETKVALAQILHKFKIEPTEKTIIPPKIERVVFGYRTSNDVQLRFVPRN